MKKLISSFLVAAMALCSTTAKADNISLEQAKSAAAYFMGNYMNAEKLTADDLTLVYQIDNSDLNIPAEYFFNVGDCGWIIMGGTTAIDPVMAYSDEGSLVMDKLPDNMMWWVKGYADLISEIQVLDIKENFPVSKQWYELENHLLKGSTKGQQIVLMNERWGQGDDYNPTYNYYCPQVGARWSVTGCVATALAQICHYYKFPRYGRDQRSYWWGNTLLGLRFDTMSFDYSLMPNKLISSSAPAKVREVAKLNYAMGVAVKMDYSPDGSGALSQDVPEAMGTYFSYIPGTYSQRSSGAVNFLNNLHASIEARNPVYMSGASPVGSGSDAAGHAWVCAGFEEGTDYYFFNWGWDGYGNAFYNIVSNTVNDMLISGMGYSFVNRQAAIFGMVPPADSLGIKDVENSLLGSAYPNPATLSVKVPYNVQSAADMNVYSIDGKLVSSQRVQPGCGEVEVRVANFPAGVYIYRLNGQSGRFVVR